jgi:sec-independent protein translocase protein TatB
MFNIGGGEVLVILLVALIVLGPQRLPEAARKVGTVIGEVRRMATGFQSEIKTAFEDAEIAATGDDRSTDALASPPAPENKAPTHPAVRKTPTTPSAGDDAAGDQPALPPADEPGPEPPAPAVDAPAADPRDDGHSDAVA